MDNGPWTIRTSFLVFGCLVLLLNQLVSPPTSLYSTCTQVGSRLGLFAVKIIMCANFGLCALCCVAQPLPF